MKNSLYIISLVLFLVAGASAQAVVSDDAIQGAVLCYNEAGENRFDCSAIIKMRMRSARVEGHTFAEELYRLHGDGRVRHPERGALRADRATNPKRWDSRPWLGDIRRDLHEPLGWRTSRRTRDLDWADHAPRFQALFEFVQGVLDGRIQDRCRGGYPDRWGGPRVDEELIAGHIEAGRTVIDCGNTQNIFLGTPRD